MKIDIDLVEKSIETMTPAELEQGIRQYFAAGDNDPDRDFEINRRIQKAYKKRAEKLQAKQQANAK